MKEVFLLDTGPLVALFNKKDKYHVWAKERFKEIAPPMLTCEPVLTESIYLLNKILNAQKLLFEVLSRDVIKIDFHLKEQFVAVSSLMHKYRNIPMDLADACLVRMSELKPLCRVLTLDSDFEIYRRNGRKKIPLITPES